MYHNPAKELGHVLQKITFIIIFFKLFKLFCLFFKNVLIQKVLQEKKKLDGSYLLFSSKAVYKSCK